VAWRWGSVAAEVDGSGGEVDAVGDEAGRRKSKAWRGGRGGHCVLQFHGFTRASKCQAQTK
jgi:hypothetical protein